MNDASTSSSTKGKAPADEINADDDGALLDDSVLVLSTRDDVETLLLDEDHAVDKAADPNLDEEDESIEESTSSTSPTRAKPVYTSRLHAPILLKVLKDTKSLKRWFFLGMFTADGVNCGNTRGFGLRSTEFESLSNLLRFMGIEDPNFYFTPNTTGQKERIAAADYGTVSWYIRSRELAEFLDSTGFPSSKVKDTKMDLLTVFEDDEVEDTWKYLLWLLGYFDGDGYVKWKYVPAVWPIAVQLTEIDLIARDKKVLSWIKSKLESIGFTNITLTWQDTDTADVLRISCCPTHNVELLQMGIDRLRSLGLTMSAKLEYLSAFLDNEAIPSTHMPPRVSFYDYVGKVIDDPIARTIAQDLYPLHIWKVNSFLQTIGMDQVTSTNDTNLVANVKDHLESMQIGNSNTSKYYACVKKRSRPSIMPNEYKPKELAYKCEECKDIVRLFRTTEKLLHHIKCFHTPDDTPSMGTKEPDCACSFDDCDEVFFTMEEQRLHLLDDHFNELHFCYHCDKAYTSQDKMLYHMKNHHGKDRTFACKANGCNKKFFSKKRLQHHMVYHKERKFKCNECGGLFPTSSNLKLHIAIHEKTMYTCSYPGCGKVMRANYLKRHLKYHYDERKYECKRCTKKFLTPDKLKRHFNDVHAVRELQCPFKECDKEFPAEPQLKRHVRAVHETLQHLGYLSEDISRHENDTTVTGIIKKRKAPAEDAPHRHTKKSRIDMDIRIMFSGVDRQVIDDMKRQTDLPGYQVVFYDALSNISSITHLVIPINDKGLAPRTQAYIRAVHEGKWIVSVDWLVDSIAKGEKQQEDKYEVRGDDISGKETMAPRKGRLDTADKKLFADMRFAFLGGYDRKDLSECSNLCKSLTGATAVSNVPRISPVEDHELKSTSIHTESLVVIVRDKDHLDSAACLRGKQQVRDEGWFMDHVSSYTRPQQK